MKQKPRTIIDTKSFILAANKIYNLEKDAYDYSKSEYINSRTKVEIFCIKHQEYFWQFPQSHIGGNGCMKCGHDRRMAHINGDKITTKKFIEKSIKLHGLGEFGYELVNYINCRTKIDIICNTCHEIFKIFPDNHLAGAGGCPTCSTNKKNKYRKFQRKSL